MLSHYTRVIYETGEQKQGLLQSIQPLIYTHLLNLSVWLTVKSGQQIKKKHKHTKFFQ